MSKEKQEHQRITNIINKLELLSLRTSTLTRKLRQLRQRDGQANQAKPTSTEYDHNLKEGDRVIIKNAYLRKKGTEGTVLYTTKT